MSLLEGRSLSQGLERVQQMLWPTLLVNWPFWGSVQCVTFTMIPLQYRVAWVSLFHVGWNAWLSGMNEQERQRQSTQTSGELRQGQKTEQCLSPPSPLDSTR